MRFTLKRSSTSWVFIAALTIETPDWTSTTGFPSSVPARKVSPLSRYSRPPTTAGAKASHSGPNAVITTVRGTSSNIVLACGGGGVLAAGAAGVHAAVPSTMAAMAASAEILDDLRIKPLPSR